MQWTIVAGALLLGAALPCAQAQNWPDHEEFAQIVSAIGLVRR